MRLDLYTSEDRAHEALAYYRAERRDQYMAWCIIGALITAVGITLTFSCLFPNFMIGEDAIHTVGKTFNSYDVYEKCLLATLSGRVWATMLVLSGMLWIFGRVSARIIAFYQAIFFSALVGLVIFGIIYLLLGMFGVPTLVEIWGPRVLGGIAGLFTFILGINGAFLPD